MQLVSKVYLLGALVALPAAALEAQDADSLAYMQAMAELESQLRYRQGTIELGDALATLDVRERFRYLDPADASRVLVDAWGNPPGGETLGMLVPADVSPLEPAGWGVVITYEEDGYVRDDEAATIDYAKLLGEMQKATRAENDEREEAGYPAIELVGWAEPPHYDAAAHKLYWAKELRFGEEEVNTLNYNVRVLGRRGVLVLNAVGTMDQLATISPAMEDALARVEFNPGNRYADFDPSVDRVAAYGIGALIAGKVAAKAGFFKALLGILVAGKKLVILAVVALGAALKGLFGRKKGATAGAA